MLRLATSLLIGAISTLVLRSQILAYRLRPGRPPRPETRRAWDASAFRFILLYASYAPAVDPYSEALLRAFRGKGAYIVYVTNFPGFDQATLPPALFDVFIDNHDQGWDFAQYRVASLYLLDTLAADLPDKIVYANDSIFYLERGDHGFIDRLLDPARDFVAAFEFSGPHTRSPWHLSSWLFSASRELFLSPGFGKFWRSYIPIKNKRHTIREGEHELTKVALQFSDRFDIIYPNDHIDELLRQSVARRGAGATAELISSYLRDDFENRFGELSVGDGFIQFASDNIYRFYPLHAFFLLLLEDGGLPFVKKDLFWFGGLTYDRLARFEAAIAAIASAEAARDLKAYFLRKGRVCEAKLPTRLAIVLGAR